MGELAVLVQIVSSRPRTSKFTTPRIDLDNGTKPILDLLTSTGFIGDDRQIVKLYATKRYANKGEQPHTAAQIKELTKGKCEP